MVQHLLMPQIRAGVSIGAQPGVNKPAAVHIGRGREASICVAAGLDVDGGRSAGGDP